MKLCGWKAVNLVWSLLLALSLLWVTVVNAAFFDSKRVLWESRDQFVALESSDAVKGGKIIPNDHPAEISQERLTEILASIQLRPEDFGVSIPLITDKKKGIVIPLFTDKSIETLVPYLQEAFQQAKPVEDVTFAIVGLHAAPGSFAKSPKATAGRMFYQGGKLNLIIGKAQYEYNERQDRRWDPFTPGNREYVAEGGWILIPQGTPPALTMVRKDWLAFSNDWKPTVTAAPAGEKGSGAQSQQPSALGQLFSGKAGKTVERLGVLKELRDKGVITEEEYRAKRLTILNEL